MSDELKLIEQQFAEAAGADDAAGDDAAGDDAGDPNDTSGIDAETAEAADDCGAPPALRLMDRELARAVRMLERSGLSERKVVDLMKLASKYESRHAHRRGHKRGFLRALRHLRRRGLGMSPLDYDVPWRRGRLMREFRNDIISRYRRMHGGKIREGRGFYYGTMEVQFSVEGTISDAAFVLDVPGSDNPAIDKCFNLAIDDVSLDWFGGPHQLNPGDTNLQNPGQNLYPDELVIVEAVSSYLKGIRIAYPTNDFSPPPQSRLLDALTGKALVWDRAGRILPGECFNQFDDTCELARALGEVSTFYFTWADRQLGGNKVINNKLIGRFSQIPGNSRFSLQQTTGMGNMLDLERGYLWCLDKQFQASSDMGGNGLFDAELHTDESVIFPFQPLKLFGSPGPVMPTGLALYWQFVVHGTSLLPGREVELYERLPRRRL